MNETIKKAIDSFTSSHRSLHFEILRGGDFSLSVNEKDTMPLASLVKIPLALAWLEKERSVSWGDIQSLEKSAYPSVLNGLDRDRILSPDELASFSLITSDNIAADIIFDNLSQKEINASLIKMGALSTKIERSFKDQDLGFLLEKNTGSASDVASIFSYLYKSQEQKAKKILFWLKNNIRNNRIPKLLPDRIKIAHKTGSLEGVVHDAGIIYGKNIDLLLVSMSSQEDDVLKAEKDIAQLAKRIWFSLEPERK